jgi:aromatic ring-opening dioxygenase catalytic subunit (LigB family)
LVIISLALLYMSRSDTESVVLFNSKTPDHDFQGLPNAISQARYHIPNAPPILVYAVKNDANVRKRKKRSGKNKFKSVFAFMLSSEEIGETLPLVGFGFLVQLLGLLHLHG